MTLDELRSLDPKRPGDWPMTVKAGALLILFIAIQVGA
jgi:hypothetical protein